VVEMVDLVDLVDLDDVVAMEKNDCDLLRVLKY
jgi:hypothetical protein